MNCEIIVTREFKRSAKKLLKKYLSVKNELEELQITLLDKPKTGILIHSLLILTFLVNLFRIYSRKKINDFF